eukprot:8737843-Alexandrium_andersonii.AAC.1
MLPRWIPRVRACSQPLPGHCLSNSQPLTPALAARQGEVARDPPTPAAWILGGAAAFAAFRLWRFSGRPCGSGSGTCGTST